MNELDNMEFKPDNLDNMQFEFKEVADDRVLGQFDKLSKGIALLYKAISRPLQLPKVFQVKGEVQITRPVVISNLSDVETYFKSLEKQLSNMITALSAASRQKIEIPKIELPKIDMTKSDPELLKEVRNMADKIGKPMDITDLLNATYKVEEAILTLANRPQMTTPPVTNININALNGVLKATTMNVGTSATLLPNVALANRRSLMIYNNSANIIYIGGSTVAVAGTGQGLPIPASSYSPTFDAGQYMQIYAISGTISSVTILEISNENIGR